MVKDGFCQLRRNIPRNDGFLLGKSGVVDATNLKGVFSGKEYWTTPEQSAHKF
jgi:hypothetical protein